MNRISELLKQIVQHIDPLTGEVLDPAELDDPDVRDAVVDLVFLSGLDPKVKKNPSMNLLNRPSKLIFDDLKAWRLEVARTIDLPAYCVFSDAELMSISEGDVIYKQDLLRVKGISLVRYNLYGDELYEILKGYIQAPADNVSQPSQKSEIVMSVETDAQGRAIYLSKETMKTKAKLAELIKEKEAKLEANKKANTETVSEKSDLPQTSQDSSSDYSPSFRKELDNQPMPQRVKENCQLYKNDRCSEIRPNCRDCADFLALPVITQEERENYPEMGDASRFKQRGYYGK